MATGQLGKVIQKLRRTAISQGESGLADGELLDLFLTHQDESAFAALVRKHGPMVWGVCRHILNSHHDCEDAFQAAFLVLAGRRFSVWPREMLPAWLHKVAYHTAIKARAVATRRRAREKQVLQLPEPEVIQREPWSDLQPLLDQELSRLPDKYRLPIVLCDLEGCAAKGGSQPLNMPKVPCRPSSPGAGASWPVGSPAVASGLAGGTLAVVWSASALAGVPDADCSRHDSSKHSCRRDSGGQHPGQGPPSGGRAAEGPAAGENQGHGDAAGVNRYLFGLASLGHLAVATEDNPGPRGTQETLPPDVARNKEIKELVRGLSTATWPGMASLSASSPT